jgi:Cdc6-like AAA superfamily ATPase
MNFSDLLSNVIDIVASIGGVGAIIVGLAYWLANILSEKVLNREKAKYEQELEKLKMQLELAKTINARYNEQQFSVYSKLWTSLYDLRDAGDRLWKTANRQALVRFAEQLRITREEVEKNGLFIEDEHFHQLFLVLDVFANYGDGKRRLIQIREIGAVRENIITQVLANREHLNEYEKVINEIRKSFRKQLNVQIY